MCYEDENDCNSIGTKHNSLSLNELLKYYFKVEYNIKDEIHDLMSKSLYLWKNRPIPYKLNYYAGCDVLYLPKIYDLIVQKCEKKILRKVTIQQIFKECEKYLQYFLLHPLVQQFLSNKKNINKIIPHIFGADVEGEDPVFFTENFPQWYESVTNLKLGEV
jgi:hypothetical protein